MLRVLTLGLIILGVVLLFCSGLVVGERPAIGSSKAAKITYLRRSAIYVGAEAVTLIGAIVCSYMVARNARNEYRAHTEENFHYLIEGALRDHKKPGDGEG